MVARKIAEDWVDLRNKAMALLQKEAELQEIVKLVGPDALPPTERALLEGARIIREAFLQQNAFHEVDTFCPEKKQYEMLRISLKFLDLINDAIKKNVYIEDILNLKCRETIARMATISNKTFEKEFKKIEKSMEEEILSLIKKVENISSKEVKENE